MASGILVPALMAISASTSPPINIDTSNSDAGGVTAQSNGSWSPPQYASQPLTMLTVPAASNGSTGVQSSLATNYVFDAVIRAQHRRTVRKTQHPVLTGANISDHAYVEPAKITLEIGMSDAMASYAAGVWVGWGTKSISAWNILKGLQQNRTLLTVTTRLDTYYNMLIIDAFANDDVKTRQALRATIIFEEIIAASVTSSPNTSARPQTTGANPGGTVQGETPNSSQVTQHVIPSPAYPELALNPNVPGAGNVSSDLLGQTP